MPANISANMELFLFYETDDWHSENSKVLLGVFESVNKGVSTLYKNKDINKAQKEELLQNMQTWTPTKNDAQFIIESLNLNEYIG